MNNLILKFLNGKIVEYKKAPINHPIFNYFYGSDGNLYRKSKWGMAYKKIANKGEDYILNRPSDRKLPYNLRNPYFTIRSNDNPYLGKKVVSSQNTNQTKVQNNTQYSGPIYDFLKKLASRLGKNWYRNKNGNAYFENNGLRLFGNGDVYDIRTGQKIHSITLNDINNWTSNSNSKLKPFYTRAYKQRVADLGLKDSEAVKAMLRQLGVKDDGIWGNKTEAAYMSKVQGDKFNNPDVLKPVSKPNYNISTVGTIDERGNITLNNPNTKSISKYNNFLNLNTLPKLQDSINKPLSLYTFAKKGTKLVSRNPIERFRNGGGINPSK